MAIEIERKFLVTRRPEAELQQALVEQIQQGYLIREAEREVRIRRKGDLFYLTEKKGSGMSRDEHEILITEQMFDALWPLTRGMQLAKARSTFILDEHRLELDIYQGELEPLMILETEFTSEEQALAWSPPWFAGPEVTGDKRYKNAQLATEGKPDNG
ncbi:CYTH domain-containing protein [Granulosicoccus sp. 3-233]|uniref:CYTH domain-containing protein n=1 Tax=Granulosicoccus sp. 3-233 TaxID=3417969 RepID=UPI003D34398C